MPARVTSLCIVPITPEHAGRSYPPSSPYEVTAAKVGEFARALGAPDDGTVPPTFPIVVANQAWQPMFDDAELGLQLQRIVHGEQKFEWQRPLRIGDVVTGAVTIDRVVNRGGTDMVYASVAVVTVDGEPICRAASTLIHTPAAEEGSDD